MENGCYGFVEFGDMQSAPLLFDERPSFSELVARARQEVHCCGSNDGGIELQGVVYLGSPPSILRRLIPIVVRSSGSCL